MTRLAAPRRLFVSCILVLVWMPRQPAAQTQASTADLIASYVEWVDGRRTDVAMLALDLDTARRIWRARSFFPACRSARDSRPGAERRRRLLTAFALELAAVGSKKHGAAARWSNGRALRSPRTRR
jgi:hypothetical protein